MEPALQTLIATVIVTASAIFAAWRLAPLRMKLRLLDKLHANPATALGRRLERLRQGVLAELTQGCGSCSHSAQHVQKHRALSAAGEERDEARVSGAALRRTETSDALRR